MKLRIVITAVTVVVVAVAGLYLCFGKSPVERIVHKVLSGHYPSGSQTELTPELRAFVDWYEPMVSDAPEAVIDEMLGFTRLASFQPESSLQPQLSCVAFSPVPFDPTYGLPNVNTP